MPSLRRTPGHPCTDAPRTCTGGGIIGCTTAYYLTRHPKFDPSLHRITLLEATAIAAGASGKAGGLLALWAFPSCLVPLSYRLHADLAREHGGADRWGYRRLGCGGLSAVVREGDIRRLEAARLKGGGGGRDAFADAAPNGDGSAGAGFPGPAAPGGVAAGEGDGAVLPIQSSVHAEEGEKDWEKLPKQDENAASLMRDSPLPADLDWIDASLVRQYEEMGMPGSTETSQVHPYYFTMAMAELAKERGVDIRLMAKVTQINHTKTEVQSVEYEDRESQSSRIIDGVTDVVVTAGPWTGKMLPRTRIEGLRAHSVVFSANVSPYAVFTDISLPTEWPPEHRARKGRRRKHRGNVDPEIYARPGGEVYACGELAA